MVKIVKILILLGLIYPFLIFLNAVVIIPVVIPGLSWTQNLALNWIAIGSIPI